MSLALPIRRRRLLLAAAAGLPVAALAACATGPAGPSAPSAGVHTDWALRPAGSVPTVGDDGSPFQLVAQGGAGTPVVRDGALCGDLPDRASASYVNQPTGAPVRRIGAGFAFGPGTAAGSLALAAWTGASSLTTPVHLVVTPEEWLFGVLEQMRLQVVGRGPHRTPLRQDGTVYEVEASLDGPVASLRLPDGGRARVSDPRIAAIVGTVPCWEFYKAAAGGAEVRLVRSWAG